MGIGMDSASGLIVLILLAIFYFAPAIAAGRRNHPAQWGIFIVNLLFGWTVIGYIVALVWTFSQPRRESPSSAAVRPCPFCAEDIMAAAVKCKHCGSAVAPAS